MSEKNHSRTTVNELKTGRAIHRLRSRDNVTLQELSTHLGHKKTERLLSWEKGASLPTVVELCKLCNFFGVPPSAIIILN